MGSNSIGLLRRLATPERHTWTSLPITSILLNVPGDVQPKILVIHLTRYLFLEGVFIEG